MEATIKIPDGLKAAQHGSILTVEGPKGKVEKSFVNPEVKMELKDGNVLIAGFSDKRRVKALVGTWEAIVRSIFTGVQKGWDYKMKIVFIHFPVTVKVDKNRVLIQNYLGQKDPMVAKILDGTQVKIEGEDITVTGADREKVGQTVGNIEQATRLYSRRDRRVFSDGIYKVSG